MILILPMARNSFFNSQVVVEYMFLELFNQV